MNIVRRFLSRRREARASWAQNGEDLIVEAYFGNHRLGVPYYLEIGAHHPYRFSNTYRSYSLGGHGVLVEPAFESWAAIAAARPRDKVVRAAIVPKPVAGGTVSLRKMSESTLNTISGREAEAMVRHGLYGEQRVKGLEEVPALTVADLLQGHCERCPDLVSLDIEGLDLPVLRSWDFKRWRPRVFVVETVRYRPDGRRLERVTGIDKAMRTVGYHAYADTFNNTVYVDRDPMISLAEV